MKLKIYNIVLMALAGLMAYHTAGAQTGAPVPATPPSPPAAPMPTNIIISNDLAYEANPQVTPEVYYYNDGSQDTAYRNKMNKLREKMRQLNKEMSDLSREESKKNLAASQEKMTILRKGMRIRLDSSFNKSFSSTFDHLRFNNFDSDVNLQKQVASGDVKEKSKTFTKSYPVDVNDKLQIDNRYGKITVNTWNKNEVKVDVDIKAYANDDADAQKLLDQTTINSSKEDNTVAFTTAIDRGESSWWGTMSQNGKVIKVHKVIINYTVYMPAKNALTINNRYGAVSLPNLDGKLNISNSYGGLVAKALTNADNVIVVRYGDANIASLTGSKLNVAYGSLDLTSCDNVDATLSYSPAKIGKLSSSGTFNVRYGNGLEISDVGKNLKTLNITSAYAPVKLGSLNDINADFDVTVHYGDFVYDNSTNVTSKTPDNERGFTSTKNYKGHIGKGNADKVITIKTSYGPGVKFD
ncbi:hypothetical protein [Mucilaginibacter sp. UR6-11]|uniref:hypothetical protein n=1 Tax=Mucilaginibacter sp. UR6-11 TaxID=1435644 RepID=UPI001E496441|nr:hypothetical protein [Mucilaginibacter sp. UR6-11]MCC8425082.1 hypothetical protein [Mucilaginibacter sp. UR6-11]